MAEYKLSNRINTDKVFLVNRSELEGRIEAEYYKPSVRFLEYHIRNRTSKKLRDYIVKIASGATPLVTEEDKYYSDKENGIPFLRVQNLQTDGDLSLDDVKYINRHTHETALKRSQVSENDLLIKITGVGRMAISSVAPTGFVGNTNQHMVVVKSDNSDTSKYLASYLNLDIIEKLATRRATGATRPALDYTALKSIPIIDELDFTILQSAQIEKQQKEAEAQALLDSIDGYLLGELDITLPEQDNSLEKRIFRVTYQDISGDRLDTQYNSLIYRLYNKALLKSIYPSKTIRTISTKLTNGKEFRDYSENGYRYLRVSDLSKYGIVDNNIRFIDIESIPKSIRLDANDFLISRSGSLGLVSIVDEQLLDVVLSSHIFKLKLNIDEIFPLYLEAYLRSPLGQFQFFQKNNGGVIPEINQSALKSILIITPPLEKQRELASYIQSIYNKAKLLREEAKAILENAKQEVEKMILGE